MKGELSQVQIDFLGITELKWTGIGHFYSEAYAIYCTRYRHIHTKRKNSITFTDMKDIANRMPGYKAA